MLRGCEVPDVCGFFFFFGRGLWEVSRGTELPVPCSHPTHWAPPASCEACQHPGASTALLMAAPDEKATKEGLKLRARGVPQLPLPQMLLHYTQDAQAPSEPGLRRAHAMQEPSTPGATRSRQAHFSRTENPCTRAPRGQELPLHNPRAHLGGEVVLLELPPFPQVPGAHGVVQPPRPQLRTVMRDVYAAGTVRVALELPGRKD